VKLCCLLKEADILRLYKARAAFQTLNGLGRKNYLFRALSNTIREL